METKPFKTYCSNCGIETNHTLEYNNNEFEPLEILAKNDEEFKTQSLWMVGFKLWQLSKCNGCEKITFKHTIRTSNKRDEDIVFYYPSFQTRPFPDWYRKLPIKYLELLREVYLSINQGSFVVALIGVRTVLDIFMTEKIGDKGVFKQKIQLLVKDGYITTSKAKTLQTAIDAGNAAAHRGFKPEKEILLKIMDIMDNLLQSEIIDREASLIDDKTPKRK